MRGYYGPTQERLKKIKVTPLQRAWLYAIKTGKYKDPRNNCKWVRRITDIFRQLPPATRRKLVAHGLIVAEIKLTREGEKEAFIDQIQDMNK